MSADKFINGTHTHAQFFLLVLPKNTNILMLSMGIQYKRNTCFEAHFTSIEYTLSKGKMNCVKRRYTSTVTLKLSIKFQQHHCQPLTVDTIDLSSWTLNLRLIYEFVSSCWQFLRKIDLVFFIVKILAGLKCSPYRIRLHHRIIVIKSIAILIEWC